MDILIALLVNTVIFSIALLGCLVVGALLLNNLPLGEPPGLVRRLWTYLTTNVAETRRNHPFPELELPCAAATPGALFTRIEHTLDLLNWPIIESDHREHQIHAVAETMLFRFKDDVFIKLEPGRYGTEIHIRSKSRVGRGDLGANARHILDLLEMLARQV